jgi:hypothetical protein
MYSHILLNFLRSSIRNQVITDLNYKIFVLQLIKGKLTNWRNAYLDLLESNDRTKTVSFAAPQDCVLHGFAGYFQATLYGSVVMSTVPKTFTKGLFSWFPYYIPIKVRLKMRIINLILLLNLNHYLTRV